jgi:hypothetical protein
VLIFYLLEFGRQQFFIAFFVWIICPVRTAILNSFKHDFPGKFLGFGFMAQAWE